MYHATCEYWLPFTLSNVVTVLPRWWPQMQVLPRVSRKMWRNIYSLWVRLNLPFRSLEPKCKTTYFPTKFLPFGEAVGEHFPVDSTPSPAKHSGRMVEGPMNGAGRMTSSNTMSVGPSSDTAWDQPGRVTYHHINCMLECRRGQELEEPISFPEQ